MSTVRSTLEQRGARYGEFADHADICQALKDVMYKSKPAGVSGWTKLPNVHKQALDVIMDKVARILSGDHNYDDNWHDIQGYAKLVEDHIHKLTTKE